LTETIGLLRKHRQLGPRLLAARANPGQGFALQDRLVSGREMFTRALMFGPGNHSARSCLGQVEAQPGDCAASWELIKSIAASPRGLSRGRLLGDDGRLMAWKKAACALLSKGNRLTDMPLASSINYATLFLRGGCREEVVGVPERASVWSSPRPLCGLDGSYSLSGNLSTLP